MFVQSVHAFESSGVQLVDKAKKILRDVNTTWDSQHTAGKGPRCPLLRLPGEVSSPRCKSARSQPLQAASCEKDNLALLLRQSFQLLAAPEMSFVL